MQIKKSFRRSIAFTFFLSFIISVSAQTSRPNFTRQHNFDVQNYIIRTSFDSENKTVFGDTTVQLKPLKDDFKVVELDAAEMNFESVKLESADKDLEFKTSGEKIYINLDRAYSPADLISIRFKYSVVKPSKGVYFVDAEIEDGKIVRAAQIWSQGEAEENHHWFPSYDFPDDKATSEQFITVGKNEIAVANGEPLETVQNADGTKVFHYKMSVPHSSYLTSFVVGTYAKVSDSYKNIPLGFYIYPDKTKIAQKLFGKTGQMIRVFEDLTGVSFPYNKYDQTIVAKFKFGGMENITATTMSDEDMFETPEEDVEDLVSHELAHSWFGDLVTCKNWSELWLNEGFATYMEAAYRERMYGRDNYLQKIKEDAAIFLISDTISKNRHGLFYADARGDDALFNDDNSPIAYQKGGAVLHTLRETVGAENFWKALNIYLNRYKFGNVETSDLQRVMEEVSGKNLNWFFAQWVYAAGYPKLNVKPIYNAATKHLDLTVTQTQELDKITPEAFILPMEIEVTTAKGKKTERVEIKNRTETFSLKVAGKPTKIVFDKDEKIPLKSVKIQPITTAKNNSK